MLNDPDFLKDYEHNPEDYEDLEAPSEEEDFSQPNGMLFRNSQYEFQTPIVDDLEFSVCSQGQSALQSNDDWRKEYQLLLEIYINENKTVSIPKAQSEKNLLDKEVGEKEDILDIKMGA